MIVVGGGVVGGRVVGGGVVGGGEMVAGAVVASATLTLPVPAVVPSLHITITVCAPDVTFAHEALWLVPMLSVACRPWAKIAWPLESSEAFPPCGQAEVATRTVEPVAETLTPTADAVCAARVSGRVSAAAARPDRTTI
ncbi:hypothetical protein Sm713_79640 [Streptomyces sp. TS71-3]|nr:hypothetical protein Sm713_79640 [Streptomyces sp. TS71-3]